MAIVRRIIAPVLIALLVIAEIATAAVGATNIRADQRRTAAIAAEKRAVATYRLQLHPIVERVFDAIQPMQDVSDAFARPAPGLAAARNDVLARSGAVQTLTAAATSLSSVKPPRTLTAQAKKLTEDLSHLSVAAKALAGATTAKGDRAGYVAAFGTGFDLLLNAEYSWSRSLGDIYTDKSGYISPLPNRAGAAGRKVPTHGGFIQQADLVCARGMTELDAEDKITDLSSLIRVSRSEAVIIRRTATKLARLKADPAASGFQHRLTILLSAHDEYPKTLEALATAASRHDPAGVTAAEKRFSASLPTIRDLSRAFEGYGAKVCANYYNVDDLLAPKGKGTLSA
jgi:hypothetical protein